MPVTPSGAVPAVIAGGVKVASAFPAKSLTVAAGSKVAPTTSNTISVKQTSTIFGAFHRNITGGKAVVSLLGILVWKLAELIVSWSIASLNIKSAQSPTVEYSPLLSPSLKITASRVGPVRSRSSSPQTQL